MTKYFIIIICFIETIIVLDFFNFIFLQIFIYHIWSIFF